MDLSLIEPELNEALIEQTKNYLAAVDSGDIDTMERFYDDSFVNIRYDKAGHAANISKQVFLGMLRKWAQAGDDHPLVAAQDTTFVATSEYGDCASVLMIRDKGDETVSYNFVWKQLGTEWRIIREFTFQDALPNPQ